MFGLPVRTEPRLRERATFDEFVALWERCSRERDYVPPMGVSSRVAGERVERFMAAVHASLPNGEVVAVGHGGTIADFLLNIYTLAELAEVSSRFAAQPYASEIMRNGAITVVEYVSEGSSVAYQVKAIALARHLTKTPLTKPP